MKSKFILNSMISLWTHCGISKVKLKKGKFEKSIGGSTEWSLARFFKILPWRTLFTYAPMKNHAQYFKNKM